MKKVHIYFLCIVFLMNIPSAYSQGKAKAKVSGTITMPVIQNKQRVFRGRMYRNRLSASKKSKQKHDALKSSYVDIIVSAKPLSFNYKTKPLPPVKILQVNAAFIPRVVPVTPGTEVQFINRDKFFHNVFSITPGSRFNIGRKPTGNIVGQKIIKLGETKLFCDIHAQMNATIICINTPYITRVRADGRFQLSDLPAGTYQLQIYHPDLDNISQVIRVEASDAINLNFTLNR